MNSNKFHDMPLDTGPLLSAMAADPELCLSVYTTVADQGKLAIAGVGRRQASTLICSAILRGRLAEADAFAEACVLKNDYGLAVIEGYEQARLSGSSHLFSPRIDILYSSPLAAEYARCLSIKISGFHFWNYFTRSHDEWDDELSLATISSRTSQTIETSRIPASAIEKALQSPACLAAIMAGIASKGLWEEAETFLERLAAHGGFSERGAQALIGPLFLLWESHPSTDIVSVIARLSLLSAPAAESLALALGSAQLDLGGFNGFLAQPSDDAGEIGLRCCLKWSPEGSRGRIEPPLCALSLSAGEIMAHWTTDKGMAIARAAGFVKSFRSKAIFEALGQFSIASTIGQRKAILEAVSLADASEPCARPGKAPRL